MKIKFPFKLRWWYLLLIAIVAACPVILFSIWYMYIRGNGDACISETMQLMSSVLFSVMLTSVLFLSNSLVLYYSALKFPWRGGKLLFRILVSFFGTVLTAALISFLVTDAYVNLLGFQYQGSELTFKEVAFQNVIIGVVLTIIVSSISEGRELFFMWKKQLVEAEQLKQENLQAQLAFLKNQINPHFLFNSLNSIFFLIKKEPQKAQDTLMKFSDILSHQLYQSKEEKIELSKELEFIENFIELEKIRQGTLVDVDFKCSIPHPENYVVPPILFTTFIENAFKHGLNSGFDKYTISIAISLQENQLLLNCTNPFREDVQPKSEKGIGLENATRRLDLLYGSRYTLEISTANHSYEVSLIVPAENSPT